MQLNMAPIHNEIIQQMLSASTKLDGTAMARFEVARNFLNVLRTEYIRAGSDNFKGTESIVMYALEAEAFCKLNDDYYNCDILPKDYLAKMEELRKFFGKGKFADRV